MKLPIRLFVSLLLAVGWLSADAAAQSCRVRVRQSVNFGSYDSLGTGNLDSTGRIRVRCSADTPILTLKLDAGVAASFSPRSMSDGTDQLGYNLFLDPARVLVWGDGTSGTGFLTVTPFRRGNSNYTVYGRTPLGQDVGGGGYTDLVTATIDW